MNKQLSDDQKQKGAEIMSECQANADNKNSNPPAVDFSEFAATSYDVWKEAAVEALKGGRFEKLLTKTDEGITLEPIYTPEHIKDLKHLQGLPGAGDYLRGVSAAGYGKDSWQIAQACRATSAKEVNAVIRQELEKGSSAIRLDFDLDTCIGQDPSKMSDGISVASLEDLHEIFEGIDLEKTPLFASSGISSVSLLAMFAALMRANGKKVSLLSGCLGADPLGMLARQGRIPCSLDSAYDEMAHCIAWATEKTPRLTTVLVRGQIYHDSGANGVQELAYAMAGGIAYIRAMLIRGLDIDMIAGQISFSFSSGANVFMEIAKFRAARLLWSQIVEAFGGNKDSRKIRMHAETSWFTKTVYDPYVNMLRTTTEAFAAVVGGVDGLSVSPFDEAIRSSDEFSRRIARNTQLILQRECNLLLPADPAGGSWYLESLTDQLAKTAWTSLQEVESQGGILAALEAGNVQDAIAAVLDKRRAKLQSRADRIVGSNMYANAREEVLPLRTFDREAIKQERKKRLAEYDEASDSQARALALAGVSDAVSGTAGGLLETVRDAHFVGATLGQVYECVRLAEEPQTIEKLLLPQRLTEEFEALRQRTEEYKERNGRNIKVFLANMGPIPQHKARAEFSTGFMEVAGFEVIGNDGFGSPEDAVQAALAAKADIAVICSTDDAYPEIVPSLARQLKAADPSMAVMLAGAPAPEYKESYDEAGVDDYIHVKANCYQILTKLQQSRGKENV